MAKMLSERSRAGESIAYLLHVDTMTRAAKNKTRSHRFGKTPSLSLALGPDQTRIGK